MLIAPYAALLALLFIVLSVRTIGLRRKYGVAVGDGGQEALLRAVRVHANFAEYVPLTLLLVFFCTELWPAPWLAHALGIALLVGRLVHAWGVSQVAETLQFRVIGTALTFSVLGVAALGILAALVLPTHF